MSEWQKSQKVGKRRATIGAAFSRPNSHKADATEKAVWFLLRYYPPKHDLQVVMLDSKSCDRGIGGRCWAEQLLHVPYNTPLHNMLFVIGHEWGHAIGLPTEEDCHLLGMLIGPTISAFTGHKDERRLDEPSFVRKMYETAVRLNHLPYRETSTLATDGMLERLMEIN